eukprot:CAMPEP_0181319848 /NCGR_PEP_ID=MMETSP1101-20121128/17797_1 /TAXON_ID=46948 /ORGANISM="Rhodomonas abbreviata, Strain Caron Lab Isolate" /LENGTH=224 /DNA_ID=CAMNT_0023427489 /DNA_START=109 /DNA_END=783 /DNA_ORIENTATION=+
MAWACSSKSNVGLVGNLKSAGIISSPNVENAMGACDRQFYAARNAFEDAPQLIGFNVTISAPHMHGMCLEALSNHLKPGMRALDVGSGSGYLTACMAIMVGTSGLAVGIEHVPDLVKRSIENVKADGKGGLLEAGNLVLTEGDGRLGYPPSAPYDAIHVGAAAPTIPEALVQQLKPGGRLIIPVGVRSQNLLQVDKGTDGKIQETVLTGVRYVPLTNLKDQIGK